MNAIQLVKQDHRTVKQLFKQFEKADKASKPAELTRIVREVTKELSVHAAIEEQILYPTLRRKQGAEDAVLEALEEHHLVKLTLLELEDMSPKDERYSAKMTVLMENVKHHIEEEEGELLPQLQQAFAPAELRDLGALMEKAKKVAPTRPHPGAPDTPPGNVIAGGLSAILDRGLDAVRDAAEKGRDAVRDVAEKGRKAADRGARSARVKARKLVARGKKAATDAVEAVPEP